MAFLGYGVHGQKLAQIERKWRSYWLISLGLGRGLPWQALASALVFLIWALLSVISGLVFVMGRSFSHLALVLATWWPWFSHDSQSRIIRQDPHLEE